MEKEDLNDTTFAVFYLSIDTLDYSVFNEDGSTVITDSSEKIDTTKIGYVLVFPSEIEESLIHDDNSYHYCSESSYEINGRYITVKSFCMIGDRLGIVYYTEEFGFIAHYAYEWDNIILLKSIGNRDADRNYQELLKELRIDDGFFPVPNGLRELL
jgi:hypothetical protein